MLYRKVINFEMNYIAIKWRPKVNDIHKPINVQVIGSFTNPPWERKI